MARHEYALHEITPVLSFRNEGYSYSRISAVTGIPKSTVIWLIKKHAADHCAKLKAPNRRGKDKGLTRCEKSAVLRNVRRDRRQTLNQLAEYGTGVHPLARTTVLRLLKKTGYAKRPTTDKPILNPVHYAARLEWAREHKHWSVEDWFRVIWSGESGRHSTCEKR
jgi:transposase